MDSLQAKLGLKAVLHFSLVVEHVKSLKRNKLTLLNPRDTLAKVICTNEEGLRNDDGASIQTSCTDVEKDHGILN